MITKRDDFLSAVKAYMSEINLQHGTTTVEHRRRLSVSGTGAKFSWTHRRRKGSVVGRGTMASAKHGPIMGVWVQKPPEAESILVIGCPTEPANLAPLVKFSK